MTPLHAEGGDAYDPVKERIQISDNAIRLALRALKPCL
jgi:hypothetical protein